MAASKKAKKYYAYFFPGGKSGVVDGWSECDKLVTGKSGARYQGFVTKEEANSWLKTGANYEAKSKAPRKPLEKGIYFDAGTGRGDGVEISVTDESGEDLLQLVMPKSKMNRHGKHLIPGEVTNNYGELLACKCAMEVAEKLNVKKIFGDSKLVVEYWSKGIMNEKELPLKTARLIKETKEVRRGFELMGGKIGRVSGDANPADLGFH